MSSHDHNTANPKKTSTANSKSQSEKTAKQTVQNPKCVGSYCVLPAKKKAKDSKVVETKSERKFKNK